MSKELSNRIKELRKKNKYTQKELAELLEVGQTTIANYEKGLRVPDAEKLNKIADLFQVTLDYLLGRDENKQNLDKEAKPNSMAFKSIDEVYKVFLENLLKGYREEARSSILDLYEEGINIGQIYFDILEKALKEVGALWEQGVIDVWKEHLISEALLDIMRELRVKEKSIYGRVHSLIALTPVPEMHNIGLKMIADMLELEGWHVVYLGSSVPAISLIKAIEAEEPDLVAISVTLPYHIEAAKHTIAAIKNYFRQKSPNIIIGGAAFANCRNVCEETGANYYGINLEDIKAAVRKDSK